VSSDNVPESVDPILSFQKEVLDVFLSTVGLGQVQASKADFDVRKLLDASDWSVEAATAIYFDSCGILGELFPRDSCAEPSEGSSAGGSEEGEEKSGNTMCDFGTAPEEPASFEEGFRMSCGHIEANLRVEALREMQELLECVQSGAMVGTMVGEGVVEFTSESYTIRVDKNDPFVPKQ